MPVILFHAGSNFFSGGYIGVDIFFVISGYLITSILIEELESQKFSLVNFYERRARRILPALFFVMLFCIPFAWILLTPFDLLSFSKSLVAVPLFLSNFFFWKDGGYFQTASELKPLLHTWSLAVEEQFYAIFPIFLMLFWRLGKKLICTLTIFIFLFSLIAAQFGSSITPVANFFLLPTRAWELACGSLVAFYFRNEKSISIPNFIRQVLSFFGLTLIASSMIFFKSSTPVPSFYSLIPTIGTALLLLFALPDTLAGKILGSRILVFIGLLSYSAYLWHQPILAFSRFYFSSISTLLMFGLILLTFIMSLITWRYIERPFRDKTIISKNNIFVLSLTASIFYIAFGSMSYAILGSNSEFGIESNLAKSLSTSDAIYASNMDERKFIKFRIQYENLNPDAIVLGSSRIMQIGEDNYPDKILNLGVSGASVEDDIAIAEMAIKKFKPSTILIGVDPWLFNSKSGQNRWKSLNKEYTLALNNLGVRSNLYDSTGVDSYKASGTTIGKKIYDAINIQRLNATDDFPEIRDKIRRDGSRVYNIEYSHKTQKEISSEFDNWLSYSMAEYKHSQEAEEHFGIFLDAYSKKYNVVLILTPYHPRLYERMSRSHPIFQEIESMFRSLAIAHGTRIIGSYNPSNNGCLDSDFYDGMHPKDACMSKVIKELETLK